jgi:hypothetical protein
MGLKYHHKVGDIIYHGNLQTGQIERHVIATIVNEHNGKLQKITTEDGTKTITGLLGLPTWFLTYEEARSATIKQLKANLKEAQTEVADLTKALLAASQMPITETLLQPE